MAAISLSHPSLDTAMRQVPQALAADNSQTWTIRPIRSADVAALKVLFRRLHAFNAALDTRFALSDAWETQFETVIEGALRGELLCLIACSATSGQPSGFAMAAVHHDSDMWRYHEWVEVEALYVDDAWRGSGLAQALLDRACEWAESIGQGVIQLYVTASNERAIRFYHHEGFGETQTIMRKVLA